MAHSSASLKATDSPFVPHEDHEEFVELRGHTVPSFRFILR